MGEVFYGIAIIGLFSAYGFVAKKNIVTDPETGKRYYELVDGVCPASFRLIPVPDEDE